MENYFKELNSIDVSNKIEKKDKLSYLSWAWAWAEVKKLFPDTIYTIYENKDGFFIIQTGKPHGLKQGVTINGIEHIEYLPVMDYRNKSIPVDSLTSFDVNKAIQRSLTKAVARHGLGLYIYAGEDLPENPEVGKPVVKSNIKGGDFVIDFGKYTNKTVAEVDKKQSRLFHMDNRKEQQTRLKERDS